MGQSDTFQRKRYISLEIVYALFAETIPYINNSDTIFKNKSGTVKKMCLNNGRIVEADDEYLSTCSSELQLVISSSQNPLIENVLKYLNNLYNLCNALLLYYKEQG